MLLCVWWSKYGIVYKEYLKPGETINQQKYCEQLKAVQEKLRELFPTHILRKEISYLHDNAKPHTARSTKQLLEDLKWTGK